MSKTVERDAAQVHGEGVIAGLRDALTLVKSQRARQQPDYVEKELARRIAGWRALFAGEALPNG